MRCWIVAALSFSMAACGGDSAGPAGLTIDDIRGKWQLTREANASCTGASGTTTYYFSVPSSATALEEGSVNVVSEWDVVDPDRFDWLVSGNFNIKTKIVELNFWHTPLRTGSWFYGTIADDGTVTGTLRDPKPGYQPHYVLGSCVFTMTGRRTGS